MFLVFTLLFFRIFADEDQFRMQAYADIVKLQVGKQEIRIAGIDLGSYTNRNFRTFKEFTESITYSNQQIISYLSKYETLTFVNVTADILDYYDVMFNWFTTLSVEKATMNLDFTMSNGFFGGPTWNLSIMDIIDDIELSISIFSTVIIINCNVTIDTNTTLPVFNPFDKIMANYVQRGQVGNALIQGAIITQENFFSLGRWIDQVFKINTQLLLAAFAECTAYPTRAPSLSPTISPTRAPSVAPTRSPSTAPSISPTLAPTRVPTTAPT